MIGLTPRQAQAMRYVSGYVEAHGRPPSYAEIRKALGMRPSCGGAVARLVRELVDRGAINKPRRQPGGKGRQMRVENPLPVPRAPDGAPLYVVPLEIPS